MSQSANVKPVITGVFTWLSAVIASYILGRYVERSDDNFLIWVVLIWVVLSTVSGILWTIKIHRRLPE